MHDTNLAANCDSIPMGRTAGGEDDGSDGSRGCNWGGRHCNDWNNGRSNGGTAGGHMVGVISCHYC